MIIKFFKSLAFLFIIIIFLPGIISAGEIKSTKSSGYVSDKLLVKFVDDVTDEKKDAIRKEFGVKVIKRLKGTGVEVWKLPDGLSADDAIKKIEVESSVEYAEPDSIYKPQSTPGDSKFKNQLYLNNSSQEINGISGALFHLVVFSRLLIGLGGTFTLD